VLFVNGAEVGRGPIRSQPRRMRYDEHDLAPFLVAAEMSDFVGNSGSSRWARSRWEAAKAGFEDFWDEEHGTYVDHFLNFHRVSLG
jgi:hypothetical protein